MIYFKEYKLKKIPAQVTVSCEFRNNKLEFENLSDTNLDHPNYSEIKKDKELLKGRPENPETISLLLNLGFRT